MMSVGEIDGETNPQMKRILAPILLALTFTVMFSSPSYAEWTKVGENKGGTYYLDFDRMRKSDGFRYWWFLFNYGQPNPRGTLSSMSYYQSECKLFRYKKLSASYYKEPFGKGRSSEPDPPSQEWVYPTPNSTLETLQRYICEW